MSNDYFEFKQFTVKQDKTTMKVGIDSVLLGSWIKVNGTEKNVLDIGSGTGLLALMMAQRIPDANIIACEIDELACEQARENILSSKWNERITVVNSDIKAYTQSAKYFDLIICNPPYFEKSLKSQNNKKNITRHDDSLSFADLIDCVHRLLHQNGRFVLILPEVRVARIIETANEKSLFPVRRLNVKPNESKQINRVILELSYKFTPLETNILILRNENGYSDDYKSITKDFYR
jgi:tRNA1Val (adenine37-N6)-methyltransferase